MVVESEMAVWQSAECGFAEIKLLCVNEPSRCSVRKKKIFLFDWKEFPPERRILYSISGYQYRKHGGILRDSKQRI